MPKAVSSSNAAPSLARTIQAKKRRPKNAGKPRPPRDLIQKKINTLNVNATAPSPSTNEQASIPQSDSSFTVSSSGGLSTSVPPPIIIPHAHENGFNTMPINGDGSDNEEEQEGDDNHDIRGSDDDEQEDPKDYCKGGYHPVTIGSTFNQRYHVIRKLGWGHFSTVWLCWDRKGSRFVAMKVVKSAKHYTETALDEIKLLTNVRESDTSDPYRLKCVQLLDDFKVAGINGSHVCMVFEVLGHNLLKLIIRSNYRGIPIPNVKSITKQVLQGLDYLHRKCQIIHTDIKPENVLMCVDEEHVRALAFQAAEWHKLGITPLGSAVATTHIVNKPDLKTMSKNKKKKLKKKQKQKQKMLEITQQQIQDAEKQKQSLLNSVNQLTITNETNNNGHKQNSSDESDEDNENEQVSVAAGAAATTTTSDDTNKETNPTEPDPIERPRVMAERTPNPVVEVVSEDIFQVKIADLGNACWTYQHFTDDIQTRQYRSLEVILGAGYDASADIWSVACMAFELATGDYLFEPHSGEEYSRDEDHIAHIIELMGPIPAEIAHSGRYSKEFFNKRGQLRNIKQLKPWDLYHVLTDKYKWPPYEAIEFAHFLEPMLQYDVTQRATAAECLINPWVTGERLFSTSTDGLLYSEQFGNGNSNENSPSANLTGAVGFDFQSHAGNLDDFLSATVGHRQILHEVAGFNPDEESDDDDMSDEYEDIDEDEQSNDDASSHGELDE
ncbi:unnamed protein product [Adineta steineri]|uniref:non-specific serine/threonine protein kinase n=2 Tax=Adineta steineri TaxID=433720 RepID=A0A815M543_9BILA|nr:unnamed protein product [Adineta steineri]CAF1619361.1 unnamed protein product [Adineta steineri]